MVQQRLREQGVAAAVPAQVDHQAAHLVSADEGEQPVAERGEGLVLLVAHAVELEVDETLRLQELKPVQDIAMTQVQRQRARKGAGQR
jgi:hypothetical protein